MERIAGMDDMHKGHMAMLRLLCKIAKGAGCSTAVLQVNAKSTLSPFIAHIPASKWCELGQTRICRQP